MLQTTQIKLKPKGCIFLVNSLGYIQLIPQLFSTVSFQTRYVRLTRSTVTCENCQQKKYKVKNPKIGSFLLTGLHDLRGVGTESIKLKPKDGILLINYMGIQFTPQLFSTMSFQTRLGRLARPTVTSENCHQNKYEVIKQKVSSISFTVLLY